jgi:hypothetical protein
VEYVLVEANEPTLFIIRKQSRESPTLTTPLDLFYVLNGVIYKVRRHRPSICSPLRVVYSVSGAGPALYLHLSPAKDDLPFPERPPVDREGGPLRPRPRLLLELRCASLRRWTLASFCHSFLSFSLFFYMAMCTNSKQRPCRRRRRS